MESLPLHWVFLDVTGHAASSQPDAQASVRSLTAVHVASPFNRVRAISNGHWQCPTATTTGCTTSMTGRNHAMSDHLRALSTEPKTWRSNETTGHWDTWS
jgi:hypothetical protein